MDVSLTPFLTNRKMAKKEKILTKDEYVKVVFIHPESKKELQIDVTLRDIFDEDVDLGDELASSFASCNGSCENKHLNYVCGCTAFLKEYEFNHIIT